VNHDWKENPEGALFYSFLAMGKGGAGLALLFAEHRLNLPFIYYKFH